MMLVLTFAVVTLALVGHGALWVGLVNRWHATGFPRWFVKVTTVLLYAGLLAIPPAAAAYLLEREHPEADRWLGELNAATAYIAICAAFGAVHIPIWAMRQLRSRRHPPSIRIEHHRIVDIARQLGFAPSSGLRTAVFRRLPLNELWQMHVSAFSVEIPRLPAPLEGLSVCHWSDLHFSGRIGREYFQEVVRLTNEIEPDVLALTGDVCDKARYIDWISETLGPANARLGKFFILGNHDLRTQDVRRLRDAMREAGFVDVGGRQEAIDGGQIVIAGNERPWFDKVPQDNADMSADDALRILLAHTPDQFAWAREHAYDLMLAGHTHGGQIRFPFIGPVICPSWHGTKYAAGFYHEPPTVLHVTRGTASLMPYRLNCPPEITKLVLTRGR